MTETMASWKKVWREGIAPLLSDEELGALRQALAVDDPRLVQMATMEPTPLLCTAEWPVEAACALAWCGWQGAGLETVGEVEDYFTQLLVEVDRRLGHVGEVRHFIQWFDDTPREEMRRELLPEVERAIRERETAEAGAA
jgi:hypothetical protein